MAGNLIAVRDRVARDHRHPHRHPGGFIVCPLLPIQTGGAGPSVVRFGSDPDSISGAAYDGGSTENQVISGLILPANWVSGSLVTAHLVWGSGEASPAGATRWRVELTIFDIGTDLYTKTGQYFGAATDTTNGVQYKPQLVSIPLNSGNAIEGEPGQPIRVALQRQGGGGADTSTTDCVATHLWLEYA